VTINFPTRFFRTSGVTDGQRLGVFLEENRKESRPAVGIDPEHLTTTPPATAESNGATASFLVVVAFLLLCRLFFATFHTSAGREGRDSPRIVKKSQFGF